MELAFCLFKVFPYGGLQRDFLRISRACQKRGHTIDVFTTSWEGETPPGFSVRIIRGCGWSNHQRDMSFAHSLTRCLAARRFDAVIGFNKLPGLDFYFAADPCYKAKVREAWRWWYRWTGRYRTYSALERAVFDSKLKTRILVLTETQKGVYIRHYQTPEDRFSLLPPGIDRQPFDFPDRNRTRQEARQRLKVGQAQLLLLMVGSGFKTKGVDRSLRALAALPNFLRERSHLLIIGRGDPAPYKRMAAVLGLSGQVGFLGTREDVPELLTAGDLLLHPSRTEAAGMVLIEAMLAGLPVLCTDVCGYAFHIRQGGAGRLIPAPFQQASMNEFLRQMLESTETRAECARRGLGYAAGTDVSSLAEKACALIESPQA